MNKIVRNFVSTFETRDSETERGIIVGHPVVYDSETIIGGQFKEIIHRGALDDCDLRDVLFFVNHDTSKLPLARSRRNNENSTMQLSVDDEGLKVRAKLDIDNNPSAAELYSALKRGDLDGMSFMFSIAEQDWENLDSETKMPTRHIRKLKRIMEVSAVNFPAYEDTSISTRDEVAMDIAKLTLDNARQSLNINSLDKDSNPETRGSEDEIELLRLRAKALLLNKNIKL